MEKKVKVTMCKNERKESGKLLARQSRGAGSIEIMCETIKISNMKQKF
jgi:hypothetical protein